MARPPHIILISDDQHRHDWLGWTGAAPIRTPHLDRLRREGVWHRHVYSNNPLCMPARCSLITGLYSHQSGQLNNDRDWPRDLPTMPQVLQRAGYHTAMIGKLHAFEAAPTALDLTTVREAIHGLGFDHVLEAAGKTMAWSVDCDWTHELRKRGLLDRYRGEKAIREPVTRDGHVFPFDEELYIDRFIGSHAANWIEGYDRPEPFFLWAGFCSPHPPYDAPASWLARYRPEEMPPAIDHAHPESWSVRRAHYAAMIELVDHEVGRLLGSLEKRGWLDDTLVLFVSDHGEMLGDHGLDGKCWPHDPSTRVPCLARWPGKIPASAVSDGLVSLIDLTATCVAAAGVDPARALPGTQARALLDHWQNPSRPHRRFVFSENGGQFCPPWWMARTLEAKAVNWHRESRFSFHDMIRDPNECRDLAREDGADEACRPLARLLDEFIAARGDPDKQRAMSF